MSLLLRQRLAICLGVCALILAPVSLHAQKALVYCPVAIDSAGCTAIVDALGSDATLFPGGIDRGHDGTSGTVDLATADLSGYSVFLVPSLADDPTAQPYALLRNAAVAARIKAAFTGRVAVWSGTPDLGSSNLDKKDALVQNLARWARTDGAAGRGPGVVALLDASEDPAVPYSWLGQISVLSVAGDPTIVDAYDNVETRTATGVQIVTWNGLQLGYTNMASGAVTAVGGTVDATGGRSTAAVLVTAAGEAGSGSGLATVTTDRQDYSPGDTVTVTGAGWDPGETVSMTLHEDPLVHGDRTLSAVADASGHIFNNSFHPEEHDFGVRFVLTATGATSGRTAQTTFTDGNKTSFALTATGAPITAFANATPSQCVAAYAQARQGTNIDNAQSGSVTLSSTAAGTTFFANGTCTAPAVTSLSFAGGGGSRLFSFQITNIGGPFTITGAGSWDNSVPNHATATIAVVAPANTPPVANSDAYSVNEDNTLTVATPGVLLNDTDADGNPLTASVVTGPATGTLGLNADGSFTYTPDANVNGPVTFTYRANDGTTNSGNATVTITVNPVNDPPAFAGAGNQTVLEDAGAQSMTWASSMTAGPANESGQQLTGFTVSNDNNALFTVQPAITGAGTLTFTPAPDASGSATVTVTLRDDGGTANGGVDFATQFFTITVTPVNDAPSFAKGPDQTVDEDAGPQSVSGWATSVSAGPNESGQTVAFQVTGNTNAALFSAGPAVAANGTLTYTPAPNASGSATVTLRITDNGGTANGGVDASATQTFVITVNAVDDAPILAAISNQTVKWGQPVSVTLSATDVDGPFPLAFSVTGGPAGNSATVAGGAFAWTPAEADVGTATFTVTVSDGTTSASRSFDVVVQPHATSIAYSGDVAGTVFATVNFKAALVDADAGNAPLVGKTVAFTLGTLATSAVTASGGAAGLATTSATIPSGTGATAVVATYTPATGEGYTGSTVSTPFTLSKAAVTMAMPGATVGYDGAGHPLVATVTGPVGLVASPASSYSYVGTGSTTYGPTAVAPRNAGTYQVTATFPGDADYLGSSTTAALTITTRQLTITATADSRIYDGGTDATAHLADNRVSGDALTTGYAAAAFADKTVGNGKPVSVTGITLGGADATNYTFNTSATALADITPASLVGSITASSKIYDGTTAATIASRSLANVIGSDVVSYVGGTATFDTKNVGTGKLVTATGIGLAGLDAPNYTVNTTATAHADITPRTLVISGIGVDREYDGLTTASVTFADDRVAGDNLTIGYTASFADKNVGAGKPVTLNTFSVTGGDAGNYTFATPTGITASITPRPLHVSATALNKVYDGTTAATVSLADDRVSGDLLSATAAAAQFADKNVGNGKPVSVTGIGISGDDAGNYTVNTTATASADITPRPLVAVAHGINRVYDGSTVATVSFTDDRVAGDALSYGYSAAFGDKNVGSAKPVAVSGITLGGVDGGNYTPNTTASTTADITPRLLTVSATGIGKIYDGTTTAAVTLADDRVTGDLLTTAYGAALFNNKHVGTGKPVSVSGITVTGADATNYTFNATTSTAADITPRALAVTADGISKVYDGSTSATVTTHDDRIAGDVVTVAYTASFADKNVGTAKPVSVSGIALGGADGGDYTPNSTTSTTADITPRPVSVAADPQSKVYGDGDPSLTYHITSGTLVAGEGFSGALARASGEDVGTYGIGRNSLTLGTNYDLSYAAANLTITPAPLTVTVNNQQKIQGGVNPTLTGSVTGQKFSDPISATFSTTAVVLSPPGTYPITATLVDPSGKLGNYTVSNTPGTLTVTPNAPPVLGALSGLPTMPVQIGTSVSVSATFTDADVPESTPYVTSIDWGDGSTIPGNPSAPGAITGSHAYGTPGVYIVSVSVKDKISGFVTQTFQYVVVYDPNGGFVTGGGWIMSPAGAYVPAPTLTGKATFGFVAKYKKGQQTPDGNTEFQFQAAGLNFKSTSYDWLVVAGNKAQYKGTGTVNGAPGYGFILSAIDGDDATRKPDEFRMKITAPGGGLVYDNMLNAPDTSDPTTELGGGSIVVHDK